MAHAALNRQPVKWRIARKCGHAVAIDLPRPRSIRELQKDPHFHELYAQLWSHLESGWSKHEG